MGAVYYFLIHPHILEALCWLADNLAFSFVLGMFFGFFIVDVVYSSNLVAKLRKFAIENEVIVKYENLKSHIRSRRDAANKRPQFLLPFRSELALSEHLEEMRGKFEHIPKRTRRRQNKNKL